MSFSIISLDSLTLKDQWIIDQYLAFSRDLRGFGVHENMYDGAAIRYPTILGLWLGRELVTTPNNFMRSGIS